MAKSTQLITKHCIDNLVAALEILEWEADIFPSYLKGEGGTVHQLGGGAYSNISKLPS